MLKHFSDVNGACAESNVIIALRYRTILSRPTLWPWISKNYKIKNVKHVCSLWKIGTNVEKLNFKNFSEQVQVSDKNLLVYVRCWVWQDLI